MDVSALVATGSGEEIRDAIVALSTQTDDNSLKLLTDFLRIRDSDTYFKHAVPHLASLGLLARGVQGVRALREVFSEAPGSIYPTAIVSALWCASRSRSFSAPGLKFLPPAPSLQIEPTTEVSAAAGRALREIVAEATTSADVFMTLVSFLQQQSFVGIADSSLEGGSHAELLRLLSDATLKISPSLLEDFRELIEHSHSEETYHQFLAQHPVFLDPLAHAVSKQRLGVDLITDFVVRRLDDKYLLVEIEKPQDRIFTQQNDFSAQFSHALGQVLDFQAWVADNVAYAQKHLPRISAPRGLLVMGRRSEMTPQHQRKLHQLNASLPTIDVATFDDLYASAVRLYENVYQSSG
jgi:hypothetical protein